MTLQSWGGHEWARIWASSGPVELQAVSATAFARFAAEEAGMTRTNYADWLAVLEGMEQAQRERYLAGRDDVPSPYTVERLITAAIPR